MREFHPEEFGEMLRIVRGERTQTEVEGATGINQNVLSNMERGQVANPSFVNICRLAAYYNLTPNDMAAMAGLFATEDSETDQFPPDVARVLQQVRQTMLELEYTTPQRTFATMLLETIDKMRLQVNRDAIVASSRLPDYIRKKLLTARG